MPSKAATPRVSVIVPAYNAAERLERALDSALTQTIPDLEVIVVDDASTDSTLEAAYRVAARDSRVRVLHNERNRGLAATRNRAMHAPAQGEWVALLDADDEWLPERLEQMLAVAGDADVVSDDVHIVISTPRSFSGLKGLTVLMRQGFTVDVPRRLGIIELTRYDLGLLKPVIRRSFLERHMLEFNVNLAHVVDHHLYFEMLASGARWLQLPDAYYLYYKHANNMSKDTLSLARDVEKSTKALLSHPAAAADPTLAAALKRRAQEWKTHAAFFIIRDLLRQRSGTDLARLLLHQPSYLALFLRKIIRSVHLRILWWLRKRSKAASQR